MLSDKIYADLVAAMKAGDAVRVSVLRMLKSELGYKQIEVQRDLADEDVVAVIRREVKKRKEAVDSYLAGGRGEQADAEQKELEILSHYLPAQMDEDQIRQEITGLNLPGDFAGAMKVAAPHFKGRADGAVVAKVVKELTAG